MTWDYSRHYSQLHPDTPEHRAQMMERMQRWLSPHLPTDTSTSVLDVGCGHGYALAAIRALGFTNLAGIDGDAGQASFARAHGEPVEHVADTVAWLRARPGQYGLVLLMDVIEHVARDQQRDFVQAISDCLRPGGRLIITTPNGAASHAGYWRYVDYTHRMSFTAASLQFLLLHGGFTSVRAHEIELLPASWTLRGLALRFFRWWRRIEYMAEFGRKGGGGIAVTPNILATADKLP